MGRSDPASHACGPELTAAPSRQAGTELTGRLAWRLLTFRDVTFVQRSFLSCEPLLGPLPGLDLAGIDWIIVGGESGPGHRPVDPAWVHELRDRCLTARVAFFFKQWGGPTPKAGGRLLDGRTWDQYPPLWAGAATGHRQAAT
jgi:protein gp37